MAIGRLFGPSAAAVQRQIKSIKDPKDADMGHSMLGLASQAGISMELLMEVFRYDKPNFRELPKVGRDLIYRTRQLQLLAKFLEALPHEKLEPNVRILVKEKVRLLREEENTRKKVGPRAKWLEKDDDGVDKLVQAPKSGPYARVVHGFTKNHLSPFIQTTYWRFTQIKSAGSSCLTGTHRLITSPQRQWREARYRDDQRKFYVLDHGHGALEDLEEADAYSKVIDPWLAKIGHPEFLQDLGTADNATGWYAFKDSDAFQQRGEVYTERDKRDSYIIDRGDEAIKDLGDNEANDAVTQWLESIGYNKFLQEQKRTDNPDGWSLFKASKAFRTRKKKEATET